MLSNGKYRLKSALKAGVVAIAAMAALTSAATAQSWDDVVAAAKTEGKVVFYNNLQPSGVEPLIEAFNAVYPEIEVEQIRLGSNPLVERFQTEFTAGRNLADVLITFPDERMAQGVADGWMAEWTPPELPNFPPNINEGNKLFTLQFARDVIAWNTNLVKPGEEPKEWTDLFDPKWKGLVGMNPPWRSVSIQQIVAFWENLGITDPAQKFFDNDVRFFEGSGGIAQAVLRGDVAIAELSDIPMNGLLEDGAPLGFVYPASGTTLTAAKAFVAAKAPHPNAGRVFMNWLMTADGQVSLQENGGLSVTRIGAPPLSKLPATADLANVVDGASIITPERQAKIVNEWREVFGVR